MGQEIRDTGFDAGAVDRFARALERETSLCERMWREGRFAQSRFVIGHELEAWLIDHTFAPFPINQKFIEKADDPMVVAELSRFNFELNGTPQPMRAGALRAIEDELARVWRHCDAVAHSLEATAVTIGILPTIRQQDLCLENISPMNRFHALNDRTLELRRGAPIHVRIEGRDTLDLVHRNVMLEAAATSFQVHLQPPSEAFGRYFNASLIVSAPLVALAANSPFLFGRELWDETRITLFEQAVPVGVGLPPERMRVTFGSGYVGDEATSVFRENLSDFDMLLPMVEDTPAEEFAHLRLQNGTIWRWVRPLIGFDEGGPHLRIEQRVMAAGPTILDMIANAAFYVGITHALALREEPPESSLPFELARRNFYRAARDGFDARLVWIDGREVQARALVEELVALAAQGLALAGIGDDEIDRYLDIVAARARSGRTGAAWQRAHAQRHARDFDRLVVDYLSHQRSGMPVHEWDV